MIQLLMIHLMIHSSILSMIHSSIIHTSIWWYNCFHNNLLSSFLVWSLYTSLFFSPFAPTCLSSNCLNGKFRTLGIPSMTRTLCLAKKDHVTGRDASDGIFLFYLEGHSSELWVVNGNVAGLSQCKHLNLEMWIWFIEFGG